MNHRLSTRTASLRVAAVTAVVTATVAAGVAVPMTAAQASTTATTSMAAATTSVATVASGERVRLGANLSSNPNLRSSLRGYSAAGGVKKLKRTKIRKHSGARHAARARTTSTTLRMALPRTKVAAGQQVLFSADVRASAGSRSHVSVGWFDASGRYLSWTGGGTVATNPNSWRTASATLTVPANAAVAETVVNVLDAKRGSKLMVTRHVVKVRTTAPATTPATTPTTAPVTTAPRPSDPEASTPASPSGPRAMNNSRTQPALIAYGSAGAASPYAQEGALVIAGRDNYDAPQMKQVSAAGGTVLVYLDTIIDASYGRYHQLLLKQSECGAAVPRWPGEPKANQWGYVNDFRVGSVLQGKLECVLEKMVAENPHIGGFFADDLGSRSWFPDLNWDAWGSANQNAYRNGAIALSKTFRKVADRHQLMFMVNGSWGGGSVASAGGGYPDASKHGNALADGAMAEHHTANDFWGKAYPCSSQWATESKVTNGKPFHFAVTYTDAERQGFVNSGCYAFAATQRDYDQASVWSAFSWTGLPSRVATQG